MNIILFLIIGIVFAFIAAVFSVDMETKPKHKEITDPDYKKYIDLSSEEHTNPETYIRNQLRYGIKKLLEDDEVMFRMVYNISKYGYYIIEFCEVPETFIYFDELPGVMTYHKVERNSTTFYSSYTLKNKGFCVGFLFGEELNNELDKHKYIVKNGFGRFTIEATEEYKKELKENCVM